MRILSLSPSVRLSVCLSVKRVDCDKTEERSFQIFNHTIERLAQFSEKKNVWSGATAFTWNFGLTGPRYSKIAAFQPIFARSASVVTPINSRNTYWHLLTLIVCLLRAFQWAYDHHRMLHLSHQTGSGLKERIMANFGLKAYITWRKSATKFLCVKNVSGKGVAIGLRGAGRTRRHLLGGGKLSKIVKKITWNFRL